MRAARSECGAEPAPGAHEGAEAGQDEQREDERGEEQAALHAITGSPPAGVYTAP